MFLTSYQVTVTGPDNVVEFEANYLTRNEAVKQGKILRKLVPKPYKIDVWRCLGDQDNEQWLMQIGR